MPQDNLELEDLDTYNMEFVSCIKQTGKYDPMLRVNIVEGSELPYDGCPKNTKLKAIIRLKKVWAWNNKWGLFWDVIRIDNQN